MARNDENQDTEYGMDVANVMKMTDTEPEPAVLGTAARTSHLALVAAPGDKGNMMILNKGQRKYRTCSERIRRTVYTQSVYRD